MIASIFMVYLSALNCLQEADEIATITAMQKNIAKVHLLQGRAYAVLGDKNRAEHELDQAVDLADQIEHCSLRWKTRLALIELRAASKHPIDAIYDEAWQLVETIAQNLTDHVLQKTFLTSALVVRLQKWAPTNTQPLHLPPTIPSLTSREIEVLRLVATGATNRHIAEALCISVKTVNAHVTNILNKTTCDNRTAAAAFAIKHRLI